MLRNILIGTRESELAVWQAVFIKGLIEKTGNNCELVYIKSDGEQDLVSPLYEMGVQGIFTKTLDAALLNHKIDIAVHSLKDVPTQLPEGLVLAATPERGNHKDVLVYKNEGDLPEARENYIIATSSLRRKAQWLNRFPSHETETLRGNINTRLQKLIENQNWNGALFAHAGIERIDLKVPYKIELDWMLPAPAQGALGIVCRKDDPEILEICKTLNHDDTQLATRTERNFLRELMGGCTMPIAAYAHVLNGNLVFKGNVLSIDGKQKAEVQLEVNIEDAKFAGEKAAQQLINNGGAIILKTFQKNRNF
ncbi:MAG: hydroxymethylbilane synthase [Bacteroidota bacterium]|nr:hydroxymethylbilane synthase [Bacteroidota bacterium]